MGTIPVSRVTRCCLPFFHETDIALNEAESDYLQASIDRREAQTRLEAVRQAREKALEQRSRMRLRALVGMMTAAAVVALVLNQTG